MPRRTFDSLRHGAPKAEPLIEPIERVLARVLRTPDGARLFEHMAAETQGPSPVNSEDRALREREGARRFVAQLRERAFSDDRDRRDRNDRDDG